MIIVQLLGTVAVFTLLLLGGQESWPSQEKGYALLVSLIVALVAVWVKR